MYTKYPKPGGSWFESQLGRAFLKLSYCDEILFTVGYQVYRNLFGIIRIRPKLILKPNFITGQLLVFSVMPSHLRVIQSVFLI